MLFEELVPIECLITNYDILRWLIKCRAFTIDKTKIILSNVDSRADDVWYEEHGYSSDETPDEWREELQASLLAWRDTIADLGMVTVADGTPSPFPLLAVINYVNVRTVLQNYTLKFQLTDTVRVDDWSFDTDWPGGTDWSGGTSYPFSVYWPSGQVHISKLFRKIGHNANVKTLRELVNISYGVLSRMTNIFTSYLLYEFVDILRNICIFEFEPGIKPPYVSRALPANIGRLAQFIYSDFETQREHVEFEAIVDGLLPLADAVADRHIFACTPQQILGDADLMQLVFSQPPFVDMAQRIIKGMIERHHKHGIVINELDEVLPKCLLAAGGAFHFLPALLDKGIIEEYCSHYFVKYGSLLDYVKTIKSEQYARIIQHRLAGKSRFEISELLGMQSRVVNRIVKHIWREIPGCSENKYVYWYCHYRFNKEEFSQIFGVPEYVYYYYSDIYFRGHAPLEGILQDPYATVEIRYRVQALLYARKLHKSKRVTQSSNTVTRASNAVTQASNTVTQASNAVSPTSNAVSQASNAVTQASNAVSQASNMVTQTSSAVSQTSNAVSQASNAVTQMRSGFSALALPNPRKCPLNHAEVRKIRFFLLREVLQRNHGAERCSLEDLWNEFRQRCQENGAPEVILDKTRRKILEDCIKDPEFRCIIMSYDHMVRFYDMDAYDNQAFIAALHLEKYDNLLIDTQIIFDDHIELMSAYDIRDYFELNFWLRKNQDALPVKIMPRSVTILAIGNVNRREQMLRVLKDHAPIAKRKLLALLHELYGIKVGSCSKYWLEDIADYYVDGEYRIEGGEPSVE